MPARALRCLLLPVVALLGLVVMPVSADSLEEANQKTRVLLQDTMQQRGIPGLQVAVIKHGSIVFSESLGLANVENHVPASRTTLFPLNSATKAFTGVAVMQLVEAGQLDLDAPVSRYLQALPPAWHGIRVRQLLAHTSGLPDIVGEQGLAGGGSEADAWRTIEQLPVEAAAGDRFAYNQTNYGLLARIIAQQGGVPYEDFLAARQLGVLGMSRTRFGDSYDLVPGAATIYSLFPRSTDAEGAPVRLSHWFYDMPQGLWAGGGLQTTGDELAAWLLALMQQRLISAKSLARMWAPEQLNDGSAGPWAAGWPVATVDGRRQVSSMGGARAAFVVYPDEGLAVIVLTNLVGANPQQFIAQIAAIYR